MLGCSYFAKWINRVRLVGRFNRQRSETNWVFYTKMIRRFDRFVHFSDSTRLFIKSIWRRQMRNFATAKQNETSTKGKRNVKIEQTHVNMLNAHTDTHLTEQWRRTYIDLYDKNEVSSLAHWTIFSCSNLFLPEEKTTKDGQKGKNKKSTKKKIPNVP